MASHSFRGRVALVALATLLVLTPRAFRRGSLGHRPEARASGDEAPDAADAGDDPQAGGGDQTRSARGRPAATVEPAPQGAAPAATAAEEERVKDEIAAKVARELQPRLAALNKTFPSQFKSGDRARHG